MIRFIITVIVVVGFLVLSIPILILEWLIGKFTPKFRDISSCASSSMFLSLYLDFRRRGHCPGMGKCSKGSGSALCGQSSKLFDILLTYSRCPGLTGYVAKDSMEKIPLLSNWMKRLYCLFLNREDVKEGLKTILKGIDQIKKWNFHVHLS